MQPTKKAPEIDAQITRVFGVDRKQTIRSNGCAFRCANPNMNFRDDLSRKEYRISGICQNCQDLVFKEEEED